MADREHILPEQVWFDPGNPEPLHDALRADYARTLAAAQRRPSLRRHVAECETCQAIGATTAASAPPTAGRKRIKLMLTAEMVHQLLRLPAHFEIVHMYASDDPNILGILVAGEGLPQVDPRTEAPIVALADVTQHPADRPS